jgi:large subunit ribosomal protein L4
MTDCTVRNWEGAEAGSAVLDLRVASEENASHIVHRALVRQANNERQGTASAKTRAEVKGGGRKPWKQKGTGRARAGSIRSPLWRGGGVIFGPKPRDYSTKMNRKERRLALRTAFQSRAAEMVIVEDFDTQLAQPKTRDLTAALARWGVAAGQKTLLIVADVNESQNVFLSARNIATVKLISAVGLNVFDILNSDHIIVTKTALTKIQEVYSDD